VGDFLYLYCMNINQVNTAILVGKISIVEGNNKKYWEIVWDLTKKELINDTSGRVYIITSDKIIKKIGGSQDKGGLVGTFSWYENNALNGRPSIRTYGTHILIYEELMNGKEVEIYMIRSKKVMASIKGLFGETLKLVSVDFKAMENICKQDYKNIYGKYPEWNFQENKNQWPLNLSEECNVINQRSTDNRKNKNK
jgi:hypothetical protein